MKKATKCIISLIVFLILVVPVFSFAWSLGEPVVPKCTTVADQCIWGWKEFLTLINNVIQFILKALVVPIAAIMFFYAGFELVTSGGSTEKRGIAKKVFTNTIIGLVIAAGAWLIIKTLLSILGYQRAWIGF